MFQAEWEFRLFNKRLDFRKQCDMEKRIENGQLLDEKIAKNIDEIELEKEKQLVNLIVEIIIKATLKDYYEEGD